MTASRRARDRATRHTTAPGRLAALDRWVLARHRDLLTRTDGPWAHAPFVDVGFGAHPHTSHEAHAAWRGVAPGLRTVATEIEPHLVDRARELPAVAGVTYQVAGFDLPEGARGARLIRAMNVLRQYRYAEVADAHERLAAALLPGGLLIEGTAGRPGDVLGALALRRRPDGPLHREALILATDFSHGFAPLLFRDRLPRDLRDRVRPDHPVGAFFDRWMDAWKAVRTPDPVHSFAATHAELVRRGEPVDPDPALAATGTLVWQPPGGVPPRDAAHDPAPPGA